jgi:hypothetical protein
MFPRSLKNKWAGWGKFYSGCPIKCLPSFFVLVNVRERITWNALGEHEGTF